MGRAVLGGGGGGGGSIWGGGVGAVFGGGQYWGLGQYWEGIAMGGAVLGGGGWGAVLGGGQYLEGVAMGGAVLAGGGAVLGGSIGRGQYWEVPLYLLLSLLFDSISASNERFISSIWLQRTWNVRSLSRTWWTERGSVLVVSDQHYFCSHHLRRRTI